MFLKELLRLFSGCLKFTSPVFQRDWKWITEKKNGKKKTYLPGDSKWPFIL